MARNRVRFPSLAAPLVALTAALALTAGCGGSDTSDSSSGDGGHPHDGAPVVVATTTWEGAFAKAAGAKDVKVIAP
jgi:zinc transport system substrate-binding protein